MRIGFSLTLVFLTGGLAFNAPPAASHATYSYNIYNIFKTVNSLEHNNVFGDNKFNKKIAKELAKIKNSETSKSKKPLQQIERSNAKIISINRAKQKATLNSLIQAANLDLNIRYHWINLKYNFKKALLYLRTKEKIERLYKKRHKSLSVEKQSSLETLGDFSEKDYLNERKHMFALLQDQINIKNKYSLLIRKSIKKYNHRILYLFKQHNTESSRAKQGTDSAVKSDQRRIAKKLSSKVIQGKIVGETVSWQVDKSSNLKKLELYDISLPKNSKLKIAHFKSPKLVPPIPPLLDNPRLFSDISDVSISGACGKYYFNKPSMVVNYHGYAPLALGDSTMVLAAPYLAKRGFQVNARPCRSWSEGMIVIRELKDRGELPHMMLINLGANGGLTDSDIGNLLSLAGDKRVIILMTTRDSKGRNHPDNYLLKNVANNHKNILLLDWAEGSDRRIGSWLSDGLHPTEVGAREMSSLPAKTLRWAEEGIQP